MNFFEKNMAVLEVKHPQLAQKIREHQSYPERLIEVSPGIFDIQDAQGKLLYQGQALQKSEEYLKKVNLLHPRLTIIYGLGIGYSFVEFWKRYSGKSESVVLLENSITFFRLSLEVNDWSEILDSGKLLLFIGDSLQTTSEKLGKHFAHSGAIAFAKSITNIFEETSLNNSKDKDYYAKCIKVIEDQMNLITLMLTGSPEDNYQAFMNISNNIFHAYGVPSYDNLLSRFAGFPGVVVSTGPSLNQSLGWLKQIQNKAVIACADSALSILLNNGIVPHLVGCLERSSPTRKFFEVEHDLSRTFLITDLSVWSDTYQKYSGPKINYFRGVGQQSWFLPKITMRDAGNSVAHLVFRALELMGCSPIFLVGQDLAYHPYTQKGHAEGIPSFLEKYDKEELHYIQNAYVSEGRNEVFVAGNNGKPILTTPVWNNFRMYFESVLKSNKDILCYNVIPKDYGAKVENSIWIDPNDVLAMFNEERDVFSEISTYCQSQEFGIEENYFEKIAKRYDLALDNLKELKEFALDTLDSISIYLHHYELQLTPLEVFKPLLIRLQNIINQLQSVEGFKEKDFFGCFVMPQLQGEFLTNQQNLESLLKFPEDSIHRTREQLKNVREWMQNLHLTCSRMENYLTKHVAQENLDKLKVGYELS